MRNSVYTEYKASSNQQLFATPYNMTLKDEASKALVDDATSVQPLREAALAERPAELAKNQGRAATSVGKRRFQTP